MHCGVNTYTPYHVNTYTPYHLELCRLSHCLHKLPCLQMECESQVGKPGIQIILSYKHAADPRTQVFRVSRKLSSGGTQKTSQHPEHMLLNNLFVYRHRTSALLTAPTQNLCLLFLQEKKVTQEHISTTLTQCEKRKNLTVKQDTNLNKAISKFRDFK